MNTAFKLVAGASTAAVVRTTATTVYEALKAYDMSVIKKYSVQEGIYAQEEIDIMEAEYKKYIALCIAHPDCKFPISEKVDQLWHTHLLFTQSYARMCSEHAGYFIHHRPKILDNEAGLKTAFADTLGYYAKSFGTPNPAYWDKAVCISANCASWDVR